MKTETVILPNGLPLIVVPGCSQNLVAVQFHVGVGSALEGKWDGGGLSHFVEHLLFKGTRRRNWEQINAEASRLGGDANAFTSFDRTVYHLRVEAADWPAALDLLHDQVFHSTFPEEEVRREQEVINRERVMGRDDPDWAIFEMGMAALYRRHGARHPIVGHDESFNQLTADDLREFHATCYRPPAVALVVAGAVDTRMVVRLAGELEVPPPTHGAGPTAVAEDILPHRREVRQKRDGDLVRGWVGFRGPCTYSREGVALSLALNALGGTRFSRLDVDLVERRELVHEISAQGFDTGGGERVYLFSYLAEANRRQEVEAALAEHLARVAGKGFTRREWEGFRRYLLFHKAAARQYAHGLAESYGRAWLATGETASEDRRLEWISTIDGDEAAAVCGRFCRPDRGVWASLGPREETP